MERRRMTNWWIHWEDLHWPNPDSMDFIKRKAEKYAEANISTAVIFGCHFRWDYMPFFTILHDYLATVAQELKQYDIELIDHHSVNLIHRYSSVEEMRRVMQHSGPHIPFSPSREAAANWEYKGKRLNDWRMIDVKNGEPLFFPQYAGEGFCHRNPEFREAYYDYAKNLIKDTGIVGIMADDAMYYRSFHACGCRYCREELKNRAGIDLPPIQDTNFWGNWDNPAWKHWVDLRFDSTAGFYKGLREAVPEGTILMACGASSASAGAVDIASNAQDFLQGNNYVNLEFAGNTPPYKNDPVTANIPVSERLVSASHHLACARDYNARCYGTGYGFTEPTANIIWALNRTLGADCHFSTLKRRLGLPNEILKTLPEEEDVIKTAFTFEKEHDGLFDGEQVGQVGIYFSNETQKHTFFGCVYDGYSKDYAGTLKTLFLAGISPNTIFEFPKDAQKYPLILVPSPLAMTVEEIEAARVYTRNGGKLVITGPSAFPGCAHNYQYASKPGVEPEKFFNSIRDGVWTQPSQWKLAKLPEFENEDKWIEVEEGIFYHPFRTSSRALNDTILDYCRKYGKAMPVEVKDGGGYCITVFESDKGITLHFIATSYHTDIDHHLDEIRYHRSRVNYINVVEPLGVERTLKLSAKGIPQVYTPFNPEGAVVTQTEDGCTISLPEKCSYLLVRYQK